MPTTKTTIEIEKFRTVKEYLAHRNITLKDYLNALIKEDIMQNGGERFNILYFKME